MLSKIDIAFEQLSELGEILTEEPEIIATMLAAGKTEAARKWAHGTTTPATSSRLPGCPPNAIGL